jgi:hypothetical protein
MSRKRMLTIAIITGVFAIMSGWAVFAQDKYTLQVPNGLAFSEFRGYEDWDGPCSTMTLHPIRSRPAPWPTIRNRGMTPSAGSRAIRA